MEMDAPPTRQFDWRSGIYIYWCMYILFCVYIHIIHVYRCMCTHMLEWAIACMCTHMLECAIACICVCVCVCRCTVETCSLSWVALGILRPDSLMPCACLADYILQVRKKRRTSRRISHMSFCAKLCVHTYVGKYVLTLVPIYIRSLTTIIKYSHPGPQLVVLMCAYKYE